MVQKWENKLTAQRLAPATVIKYHRVLSEVCKHAVNNDDLIKNPCDGVKLPKRTSPRPNSLDEVSYKKLAAALDLMQPTPVVIGATIALYTGMRQGEICGLRWRCYDPKRREIYVEEAIGKASGVTYSKEPKTKQSRRTIPVAKPLAAALERRITVMKQNLEQGDYSLSDTEFGELYVIGYVDGRYYSPYSISREWAGISKSFGLIGTQGTAVTFHDLRHTFATRAIAGGIDVRTVSAILGHSSTSITLDVYADADPQNKRRAIEQLDETLNVFDGVEPFGLITDVTSDY